MPDGARGQDAATDLPPADRWTFVRLIGDAADSPIVDAGSPNQISGGLGVAYAW